MNEHDLILERCRYTNNGGAMFDDTKYIECPREEATHVYFAGNAHLSAEEKQDVPWCAIRDKCISFYAPGFGSGDYYTYWEQECAPEEGQRPLFLKERVPEVKFEWNNLNAVVRVSGKVVLIIVDLQNGLIRRSGKPGDPSAVIFDTNLPVPKIQELVSEYAQKIARGEL